MCNPAVVAYIPQIIAAVGAGVGAYAQIRSAEDAKRIEQQNAYNLEAAADDAMRRGHIEEEQHRMRVRAMLGAQRARFSANNVDVNTGSPLGLLAETAQLGELDALTIRNNAAREAMGYRQEGTYARARGRATRSSGRLEGAGTLLASGANAYGMWRDRPKKVA